MNRDQAIAEALKYANDFTIQHTGVTRDYCLVTGLDCVRYQKRHNNLLLYINGNWRHESSKEYSGWKQDKPLYHWFVDATDRLSVISMIGMYEG